MRYTFVRSRVRSLRVGPFTRLSFIPHVEYLEERITPDVVWTGKGTDNEWGTSANWDAFSDPTTHHPPTKDDIAFFLQPPRGSNVPYPRPCPTNALESVLMVTRAK
jgi:hypothetical protein